MDIKEYGKIYNNVAKEILASFAKSKTGENLVLSPMSIIVLLGIAADAVQGKTRDEITGIIGEGIPYDELMEILSQIQSVLSHSDALMSSNAVCVKESIKDSIAVGYEARLKGLFDGKLFSSNDIVRDINLWVSEKTQGMIENAADESMNQALACLMNAIAFESEWETPYWDEDVRKGKFHNADGSESTVQMMRSTEYSYVGDARFSGFIKPYKDQSYSFMALLPRSKSDSFLLKALDQIDFSKLAESASFCEVQATMPEFKYDFGEDLTELCKELGIQTLFSPAADFSPMSSEWLKVDSIVHKAHIEVDRHGTKAAAVTMEFAVAGCAPIEEYKTVTLNRPFVYAIMNTETGLPVFTGVFNTATDFAEDDAPEKITAKTREDFISFVVKDCLANLPEDQKDYLVSYPAIMHHFGYGMYIRNRYIHNKDFSEAGFYDNPDDLSGDIVEQIIIRIKAERWATMDEEGEKHVQ